jgi:hypothetical protein
VNSVGRAHLRVVSNRMSRVFPKPGHHDNTLNRCLVFCTYRNFTVIGSIYNLKSSKCSKYNYRVPVQLIIPIKCEVAEF